MRLRERFIISPAFSSIERPLVTRSSIISKPPPLLRSETSISPDEAPKNLIQWTSESNLEPKEDEKKTKLMRSHRSAGDMRSHFGLQIIPAPKKLYRNSEGNDPLFFLDLTYEDSDDES